MSRDASTSFARTFLSFSEMSDKSTSSSTGANFANSPSTYSTGAFCRVFSLLHRTKKGTRTPRKIHFFMIVPFIANENVKLVIAGNKYKAGMREKGGGGRIYVPKSHPIKSLKKESPHNVEQVAMSFLVVCGCG